MEFARASCADHIHAHIAYAAEPKNTKKNINFGKSWKKKPNPNSNVNSKRTAIQTKTKKKKKQNMMRASEWVACTDSNGNNTALNARIRTRVQRAATDLFKILSMLFYQQNIFEILMQCVMRIVSLSNSKLSAWSAYTALLLPVCVCARLQFEWFPLKWNRCRAATSHECSCQVKLAHHKNQHTT